jgi:hypothetical protein
LGNLWLRFCARLLAWSLKRPKRTWGARYYRQRPVDDYFAPGNHMNHRCTLIKKVIPAVDELKCVEDWSDHFVNWTWSRMMEKTEELWPNIQNMPRR